MFGLKIAKNKYILKTAKIHVEYNIEYNVNHNLNIAAKFGTFKIIGHRDKINLLET